jgi:hypothetical protein
MPQPKFLAVACFERKLTVAQAWQIAEEAERYVSLSVGSPRFGEIAVDLGLLTPETVEWILGQLRQYILENKSLNDPLSQHPPRKLVRAFSVRRGAFAGSAILLLMSLSWYLSDHNWGTVALVASVLSALWIALTNIIPDIFDGSIPTHRFFPWIIMVIGPLSWGYCIYVAHDWLELSRGSGAPAVSHWHRLLGATVLLGAAYLIFYIISKWRHFEIWFLECRIDLMRGLVSRTFTGISRLRVAEEQPERQVVLSYVHQVLQEAARIMIMNPWSRLLKKFVLGRGPVGVVSIWYLEPDTSVDGSFSRFNVLLTVAPNAPTEVTETFEKIRRSHHPTRLDTNRFHQAFTHSMKDGEFDEQAFIKLPDRRDFVSVVGFDFENKQGIYSGNALRHPYFDHTYTGSLNMENLSYTVRRWLDFKSFAAYPVLTPDSNDKPIGVLIAFKNLRNGFTPEDKTALVTTSRLLGLLLSEGGNS